MSGFARLLAAACVAAALSLSASAPAPAARTLPSMTVASLDGADPLAAQRVLLRRRDCSKWWTCGPFKREKPRLA